MNNQITPVPSTLLRNKLGTLAQRLQEQGNPSGFNIDFPTLEQIVSESIKILGQFYKNLSEPILDPATILPDTVPDTDLFNDHFIQVQDDLNVLFSEFENLEGVILGEFNYMTSRLNRLNRKLKLVSSTLGDFILFSDLPTKDAIFFADSFNNLSRVEVNSPLLNQEQAEINQVEGIATLPIDRNAQVALNIQEVPVINSNSNGTVGNNQEEGAQLHGTITDILDNNPDTWFEYERVVDRDDGEALVLDFTINIGSEKIVNSVRINPNNFGTRTQVEILSIDTSIDGQDFVSIKDDIPIAGFTTEDEENVFTLAPSTSKFAGQGLYTFTPRKAKYFHIILKQKTPYVITTAAGREKFRYAIGVRDVEIQALPYKDKGELISINHTVTDEIRKVVLLSNQNPVPETNSILATINHYISPDNGLTWHQIRPKISVGLANVTQEIPELLDFNGVADNSINTDNPVFSLRYKAIFARNTEAFTDSSSELAQEIANITELHQPPTTTPFNINLEQTPITGTLKLIDPSFGSRGKSDIQYRIATGDGSKKVIRLPFAPLVKDFEKDTSGSPYQLDEIDPQQIYVNGELWTRGDITTAAPTAKVYKLNFEEGILESGDGTNGVLFPSSAVISMTLSEERLFPARGSGHIAKLDYPTANDKKQVEINIVYPSKSDTIVLKKGANRHVLKTDIQTSPAPKFSDTIVFSGSPQTFKDGSSELSAPGHYSIDYTNGIAYSYDRTKTNVDTTVVYDYIPRSRLTENHWNFVNESDINDAVSIVDGAFTTFDSEEETIPAGVKYLNLGNLAAVRGTVNFSGTTLELAVFQTEVEYVDGRSELLAAVKVADELDAITGTGAITIPFKLPVISASDFSVTFTNSTVFSTDVSPAAPTIAGQYKIDRSAGSTGEITVYVDSPVSNPGNVNYYYEDPQANLTGRYSVNYKHGEVFLHDATVGGTVTYEYTDIRAKYPIARLIPSDDWEFDTTNNRITIKDREILKNMRVPQTLGGDVFSSKYYQASYEYVKATRANVSELEPYFSPVIKDYALRIVTKSRLS